MIRGKKKITLTEEGVILRKRAEEIVELVEKTEQEISYDLEEVMGDLYIGGSISESVLAVAAELKNIYPGIHFHFYSGDAVDVSERLNHGSLDFAVMLEPIDNIKYDFLSLPDCSEWGILMKKSDPLAMKKALTKDDIKRIPLIMHQRIGLQNEIAHWAGTDLENLNIAATRLSIPWNNLKGKADGKLSPQISTVFLIPFSVFLPSLQAVLPRQSIM